MEYQAFLLHEGFVLSVEQGCSGVECEIESVTASW